MFVASLTADVFAANCYLLARAEGGPCVVVDPGYGVADPLRGLVDQYGFHPRAVLLTHGHVDHTADAPDICATWDIPVYITAEDRAQLRDPATGIPMDLSVLFGEGFIWREPQRVLTYPKGVLPVADLEVEILGAPGHTPGSALLRLGAGGRGPGDELICLTGDVLFSGSIGRTDLPGGDLTAMRATLRDTILSLDDATTLLPGHGPATTMERERRGNPFLRGEAGL